MMNSKGGRAGPASPNGTPHRPIAIDIDPGLEEFTVLVPEPDDIKTLALEGFDAELYRPHASWKPEGLDIVILQFQWGNEYWTSESIKAAEFCYRQGARTVRFVLAPTARNGSLRKLFKSRVWTAERFREEVAGAGIHPRPAVWPGSAGETDEGFEGEPRAITADLLPVPELEPDMIPEPLRAWIEDIAARGCFPLEYPAAAAIVSLSGLIGRRIAIRPKRRDDWLVIPNLWGAVVGPPGIQKTPAVEEAMRPLARLAKDSRKEYEEAMKSFEVDRLVAAARKNAAEQKLKERARKNAGAAELARLAAEATTAMDAAEPVHKRYQVNDATMEKLGELLRENPNGLTCFRDELIGFLRTLDRQGHEADRGFYLESWNGFNPYVWDRIQRGTVIIPNVCLAIFGGIPPGPLAHYLRGSLAGEEADGFMPRFQVLVYPDPPGDFVNVDRFPDTEAKNKAYDVFRAIDAINPQDKGCLVDDARQIPYISFAHDAQEYFDDWRVNLERRLRSGQEGNLLTCHLAKYRKLLPALAGQFHLIDTYDSSLTDGISLAATKAAARWCDLLEAHARRTYQFALDGDPQLAINLLERVKRSLPNPFTFRQVAQKGWTGLGTVDDVRRAVGVLVDRNCVKVVEVPAGPQGGRPSEQVYIHPMLLAARSVESQITQVHI